MKLIRLLIIFLTLLQNLSFAASSPSSLEKILHQLPEWKEFGKQVQIERIDGGLTNHNLKVIFPTQAYFIRMGSDNPTLLGLDSKREYTCTKEAAALGIAPDILFCTSDHHIMVMPFIPSQPVEKNDATYQRILSALRQFHLSGKVLPTTFCPYKIIQDYVAILDSHSETPLAPDLLQVIEEIRTVVPSFQRFAPCHLDLYNKNFLDDGKKIWIIDWEYSAMADPLYDLATWASSDQMSVADMQKLLEFYSGSSTPRDLAYLYVMSILVDIRWGLWSMIQSKVSRIEANYEQWADFYFSQARRRATDPQYKQSLLLLSSDLPKS